MVSRWQEVNCSDYVNLIQARVTSRKRNLRKCLQISSLKGIFLINDWLWRALFSVGTVTPGQLVLSCLKEAEQVMRNKPVGSIAPKALLWFLPPSSCLELLPSMMDCDLNYRIKPFLPKLFWVIVFYIAIKKLIKIFFIFFN